MFLVNKSRGNKAIVLAPRFYFVWIHHELREHAGPVKCHHADEHSYADDSIGYKKHVSLHLYLKNHYEEF